MKRVKGQRRRATISSPTIADAILDRLVHNAHRIELTGTSMRTKRASKSNKDNNND